MVGSSQGSADDAYPRRFVIRSADAGLSQLHRRCGTVLSCDDHKSAESNIYTKSRNVCPLSVQCAKRIKVIMKVPSVLASLQTALAHPCYTKTNIRFIRLVLQAMTYTKNAL